MEFSFGKLETFVTEYDRAKVPPYNGNDPRPANRLKALLFPPLLNKVQNKGMQGVQARYGTELPPFISIVRCPGRPVILGSWEHVRHLRRGCVSSNTLHMPERSLAKVFANHFKIFRLLGPSLGPAPLQKCVGDFGCTNFGRLSWRIFLGTFSHRNEEKKSGDKIREKIGGPNYIKIRENPFCQKPTLKISRDLLLRLLQGCAWQRPNTQTCLTKSGNPDLWGLRTGGPRSRGLFPGSELMLGIRKGGGKRKDLNFSNRVVGA